MEIVSSEQNVEVRVEDSCKPGRTFQAQESAGESKEEADLGGVAGGSGGLSVVKRTGQSVGGAEQVLKLERQGLVSYYLHGGPF